MTSQATTYYCEDAAERIAELIIDEQRKRNRAESKEAKHDGNSSKQSAARRDQHRAETAIRSLKQALGFVLLEHECRDGQPHEMPDVDEYLIGRAQAA